MVHLHSASKRQATTLFAQQCDLNSAFTIVATNSLNARYARGEIDQAEYREKRAVIASGTGGES
jgi:uncharacterized membrane protein